MQQTLQQLETDIDVAGALYDRLDKADTRLQLVAKHVGEGGPYIALQCSQLLQEAQQVGLVSYPIFGFTVSVGQSAHLKEECMCVLPSWSNVVSNAYAIS
jgi:hypothetical protein